MLEAVKTQIDGLIALYEAEKVENQALRSRVATLGAENDTYRKQISELEEQIGNLKLREAFLAPADANAAARARLAGMIREIDKCIALLES